jgi:AcrR family transcriptional regulator
VTTKQQILKAVKKRFDHQGLVGLSMRALAKDVGLTPMALYRHYADKEALIDALTIDALDEWHSRVIAIREPDAMTWLWRMSEAFLEFALHSPRRFEAAFELPARNARQYPDDIAAGKSPVLKLLADRITEAQRNGAFAAVSPTEVAMAVWALGQGMVTLYRANRFTGEADFRAAYRAVLTRLLAGYTLKEPSP